MAIAASAAPPTAASVFQSANKLFNVEILRNFSGKRREPQKEFHANFALRRATTPGAAILTNPGCRIETTRSELAPDCATRQCRRRGLPPRRWRRAARRRKEFR